MKIFFLSLFFASIIFLVIDIIWLSFSIKNFYKPYLSLIPMNEKPILWAGILFYLLYVMGLTLIVILPALDSDSFYKAIWTGLLFGLVAYGTYNLTNMSFIKNWSPTVVIIDMIWGGLLSGAVAGLTYYIIKNYFKFS